MNLVFIGKSGSGKTEICKELVDFWGYNKIISTTTREQRNNETDCLDYNFVSLEEFENLVNEGLIVCKTFYAGGYYGINKNDMLKNKRNIIIVDVNGLEELSELDIFDFISFYVDCDDMVRYSRQLDRGDTEEYILEKQKSDEEIFTNIDEDFDVDFVVDNNGNIDETIHDILTRIVDYIEKEEI